MQNRIDAHQHFWKFDPVRDAWIDETMVKIQRDFMPNDLYPVLTENQFEGCVAVQASQTDVETHFLLDLAAKNSFIKGVVGWVDLLDDAILGKLDTFSNREKLKGFRQVVQVEADDFMLRKDFKRGIAALNQFGYTYDILIFHRQLPAAIELVNEFPNQAFVLDHIAKPDIKSAVIQQWKKNIIELSKADNTMCKISGMVTEANWKNWTADDLKPYLDVVFECFGSERLMFGSDWPVCLVAAEYDKVVQTLDSYMAQLSKIEQENIWYRNANSFYKLDSKNQ